jgi:cytochrome c553
MGIKKGNNMSEHNKEELGERRLSEQEAAECLRDLSGTTSNEKTLETMQQCASLVEEGKKTLEDLEDYFNRKTEEEINQEFKPASGKLGEGDIHELIGLIGQARDFLKKEQ